MKATDELRQIAEKCVKGLCDDSVAANVTTTEPGERTVCIFVNVARADLPRVIGKCGANITAVRTIVHACAAKHGVKASLILNE